VVAKCNHLDGGNGSIHWNDESIKWSRNRSLLQKNHQMILGLGKNSLDLGVLLPGSGVSVELN
jgi:hypothetical protein